MSITAAASFEELETTNEELQSTNEELETMNEELQSTNDELHAVNDELRVRGDEVDQLNHFLQAVFTSFGGAVVVVDTSRRIRVWNPQAEEFWGLREDEVRGVDLLTLDIGLPVNELARPLQACLARSEDGSVTVSAITRRGRKVECRVTLTPLHAKGAIDGALMVMDVVPV
jgi:two-component system CheB/CheR fusion protein